MFFYGTAAQLILMVNENTYPSTCLTVISLLHIMNEVSNFDAYLMPRVDELIEWLGPARYHPEPPLLHSSKTLWRRQRL